MLSINTLQDKLSFFLHSNWSKFLLLLLLLIMQLMDKQFTDYWSFHSFPGFLGLGFFFITPVCDCHLCSVELLFAFGLMTEIFWAGEWWMRSGFWKPVHTHVHASGSQSLKLLWRAQPVYVTFREQQMKRGAHGWGVQPAEDKQMTFSIILHYLFHSNAHASSHVPLLYGDLT